MSVCISLAGSTKCPSFAAYKALLPPSVASFVNSDIKNFDLYIQYSLDFNNDANTFGSQVRDAAYYNCPNWDGTGFRYVESAYCAYFVAYGVNFPDGNGQVCNPAGTTVPLCQATLNKFNTAWNNVFSSKTFCPSGASSLGIGSGSLANAMIANIGPLSTAGTCLVAEGTETNNCGFATAAEAKTFCATASVSAEPCCAAFAASSTAAAPAVTSTAGGAATTTTGSSSNSNSSSSSTTPSLPVPVIAGAAGGAVLLLAIVIFCLCRKKKKQAQSTDDWYAQKNGNYGMQNMDDKAQFSNKGAPMGYAAGPLAAVGATQDSYEAVFDYPPNASDELAISVGDRIILKQEYDDGWGFGFNTRTKREGVFPLDILDKYAQDAGVPQDHNPRVSSMYGGGGASQYDGGNSVYQGDSMYQSNTESMYQGNTDSMYQPGTDSVYYGNNTDSMYDAPAPAQGSGGAVHLVTYDFNPEQRDEIELRVGDKVLLVHQYDDGWAKGTNKVTNQSGLFPLDCLQGFDGGAQQDVGGKKMHNNRVSSMYGASEFGGDSVYYGNGTESVYQDSEYQAGTDSVYYGNGQDSVYYGN